VKFAAFWKFISTISKFEYQMTKTFLALTQYLFETSKDILCFGFGVLGFVSDFVLRV